MTGLSKQRLEQDGYDVYILLIGCQPDNDRRWNSMRSKDTQTYLKTLGVDLALVVAAAVLSYYFRKILPVPGHAALPIRAYLPFMFVMAASWLAFLHAFDMYGGICVWGWPDFAAALLKINYNFVLLVAVVSFILRLTVTNRVIFLCFIVLINVFLTLTRMFRPFAGPVNYGIVGTGVLADKSLERAEKVFGIRESRFRGFFADAPDSETCDGGDQRRRHIDDAVKAVLNHEVDTLILAMQPSSDRFQELLDELAGTGVRAFVACEAPSKIDFLRVKLPKGQRNWPSSSIP